MACKTCLDEPLKDKLCTKCYARRVHKRITKALRGTLDANETIVRVVSDNSAASAVLVEVLTRLLEKSNRELKVLGALPSSDVKVFVSDTLDVVIASTMDAIAKTGSAPIQPENVIAPLKTMSLEDCQILAKHWDLKFEDRVVRDFPGLNELDEKYPKSKATLAKALHLL